MESIKVDINKFVHQYSDKVFSIAYYMTGNHHDAHDLAQETFLRVINAIRTGICDITLGIESYFYRVLKNLYLDNLRKKSKENVVSVDEQFIDNDGRDRKEFIHETEPGPDTLLEKKALEASVRNALDQIPAEFKIPVIMCDIEGMSYEEISNVLQCPKGTVRSRIHRGRKYLAEILDGVL